jgi:hypothetical protein
MTQRHTKSRQWNFSLAAMLVAFGCGTACMVHAQETTPPAIDADALKMPKPAGPAAAVPVPNDSSKEVPAKLKAPSIDLGKYDLKLDAGKTSDVVPRTGFDSGETSNLSKSTGGKTETVTPDYFGLKLSVPTK